jgi:D-alanine-D-alanine ligase
MSSILVICGGTSAERDVSLRSGAAVMAALQQAGHAVTSFDSAENLPDRLFKTPDVVFPLLHGAGGEDGVLQARLEALNVPYVGSDSRASALCFDKWTYKRLLQDSFTLPEGELVTATSFAASPLRKHPFVLKPHDGGSSVDTFIVRDPDSFTAEPFATHERMLLERLVEGQELTVGILGDTPLPVIEIIPPQDGEFDYDNKYNGRTTELCPPLHIDSAIQAEAQHVALEAHRRTGCRHLSRSDFMVDKNGTLYLLETNTIPGMTNESLLPKMAATAGMDMPELCDKLVRMALNV